MWLYLPTSSPSVPATAASTLALDWLAHFLEPSVTWKGKLLSRKSWLRVLKTAPSTRLLFGRTLPRLMASRGVASWISSVAATRASRLVARASGSGRKTHATSGRTSPASLKKCSPNGVSSKTSMHIYESARMKSLKNWNVWVTELRRDSLARRKSAHRIGACDYSPWPTARQEDAESCGNHPGAMDSLTGSAKQWKTPHGLSGHDKSGKVAGGGGEFAKQAMSWQTPATDSFRSRGGDRVDEPGLDQQARQWRTPDAPTTGGVRTRQKSRGKGHQVVLAEQASNWPTPEHHIGAHDLATAVDEWPTPQNRDHRSCITGDIAKKNSRPLSEAVGHFPPALTTLIPGRNSSLWIPRLNPRFVELLMGLIPGWTASEPLATESFHWWWRMHTALLDRLSKSKPLVKAA
jgi:hypothetical protein